MVLPLREIYIPEVQLYDLLFNMLILIYHKKTLDIGSVFLEQIW